MAEPRKTSNHCEVAERVSCSDVKYFSRSEYIAAIDFGTTNCSLAYILSGKMSENGPKLLQFDGTVYRVMSASLFNPEGSMIALGETARTAYKNVGDEERLKHAYFEQIKMDLQHEDRVGLEMKVKASNGREYYLVEVIAHMLKYLKDEFIRVLRKSELELKATDFDWVITVPAIWKARGKQMMREAGYMAGLCSKYRCQPLRPAFNVLTRVKEEKPDKLSLALEPESAAIFGQYRPELDNTPKENQDDEKIVESTTTSYLVVDIGGGTVDISAHCIDRDPEPHIKVIHSPTGNDLGGSRINGEFRKFLEDLVQDPDFTRFVATPDRVKNARNRIKLDELLNKTFEMEKKTFSQTLHNKSSGKIIIELPHYFVRVYGDKLEENVSKRDKSLVTFDDQDLQISRVQMCKFFEPIMEGIIACITNTLDSVPEKIEKIYLVGGFGGSKYVASLVDAVLKDRGIECIVPIEPAYAVARGAALFKLNPHVIESRRVDATYGIATNHRFVEGVHDPRYRWRNDDKVWQCGDLFSTVVEHGDIVSAGDVFKLSFCPSQHNQVSMQLKFYSSLEKDVFYVTGDRGVKDSHKPKAVVSKIGQIVIKMPILNGDKNRYVDVMFSFSHTEIKVTAVEKTSKTRVITVLNFLSSHN